MKVTGVSLVLVAIAAGCGDGETSMAGKACQDCHAGMTAALAGESSHTIIYNCSFCHEARLEAPGEGHADSPVCGSCHSELGHMGHSCLACHEPHGTPSLFSVRQRIRRPDGGEVLVDFRASLGLHDFSHAEPALSEGGHNAWEPGTGVCEVCHTRTRYYDNTGTGEAHNTSRCTVCHNHGRGFAPPPSES